ncbi:MAG: 30S ribosome-binding factor RbfA [Candidatus Anaerobiospirillum merdipullorum]|uniref:Ribosome-binding factor A n=1 Tax=Candidatus Anaerobiospirillum merdipullorum TaxID=2838450 RepID=A0A9E2NS41_9GAMM|nr:30S ribosome-binding factor RbfA [Candidatus Anaerobiospirillum merdipullorum]
MPKAYGRKDRVAALMLQETAQLLQQEIKDPRVKMATVTEVSVSPDLKNAKIFVSFLTDKQDEIEEALVGLNSAAGFIRSTLAKRLKLRYMPQISFAYDSLQTEAMRLDALIAKGLNKDAPLEDDAQS